MNTEYDVNIQTIKSDLLENINMPYKNYNQLSFMIEYEEEKGE